MARHAQRRPGRRRAVLLVWAIRRRVAPRRSAVLLFLAGCGLVAVGALARSWLGQYRMSAGLLRDASLPEVSEDLLLSFLAYRYLMLLTAVAALAGVICCVWGIVKAVRTSSIVIRPGPPKRTGRRSRRVSARVIGSSQSSGPARGRLLETSGRAAGARDGT